ncbi:UDP-N-acetylglucosamine 4,6-dehydratase [Bacteriovorax sp. BAL6_X]|uniref:UDP-N-acetylglucosamine 4,6-dehydratase (inverting) n=1 Tax=Bacteriovorax sp. BAL6_X TaxID=1201290 RepID=UPI00038620DB|nr:UDP-N-acetylglucosamine 4,6-dehydratase (inverting) [Bacteriovorax sp. BAL6_X]EPZ50545.1 UDP-N-acetylglucosamine 4,6-dehydratase [Bacteriovorax sp. BAL6_X]
MNYKSILVTGGTGSFGKRFISRILEDYPGVERIVIFSRDELKQFEMANIPEFKKHTKKLRFFIGNVRDGERLRRACEGIDVIVHAAALKQVPAAEYNPMECIKTNILGAENVVNAALDCGVKKVVALSTDKAAAPINLYGATKLCSDKLIVAANNMRGNREVDFSVVRYGNVMGSRGSVIPFFMKKASEGVLPITDSDMTRFNITLDQGVDMVLYAMEHAWGGEIFVPKIPSYKILDVANSIGPNAEKPVIGIRPGEKLHEEMITETDSFSTIDCGKYYVILPSVLPWDVNEYMKHFNAKYVEKGFKYNSGTNTEWVTVEELRELIKEHVDPNFKVVE